MEDSFYVLPVMDGLLVNMKEQESEGEKIFLNSTDKIHAANSAGLVPQTSAQFYVLSEVTEPERSSSPVPVQIEKKLENVDGLAELVPALKCLKCPFVTLDKTLLIYHHKISHNIDNVKTQNQKVGPSSSKRSLLAKAPKPRTPGVCKFKESDETSQQAESRGVPRNGSGQDVTVLFICGTCNKAFASQAGIMEHMLQEHKAEVNQNVNADSSDDYSKSIRKPKKKGKIKKKPAAQKVQCDVCKEMFANKKVVRRHMRAVHSNIKPFVCHVCGHTTTFKNHLLLHTRQHNGERPFACKRCDYRASDHNTLRRHVMRHEGVKPYKSPVCDYASTQRHQLTNHLKTFHPDIQLPDTKKRKICNLSTIPETKREQTQRLETENKSNSRQCMRDIFLHEETSEEPLDHGGVTIPAT